MTDCNQDILTAARANIAAKNNPAHRNSIFAGDWDNGTLVRAEIERLLKEPPSGEGDE